jgi:flagellin
MVSMSTNIGAMSAKRYLEINTAKSTRATEELSSGSRVSNPSYDPSSAAIGYRLNANISALQQTSRNVSQALSMIQMGTGALGSTSDVLTRLKTIATQANTDTIGASERAMLQQEYNGLLDQVDKNASSARWGGIALFGGGAGAASADGAIAEAATGLTAVANAFSGAITAGDTQGFISGVATAATVTQNGALYNVSVTIGGQVFTNTSASPLANGSLVLTSTVDPGSSVALTYAAAVTAISSAATFQTSLQTLLGINQAGVARASFDSLSTNAAPLAITSGSGMAAGRWALSYSTATGTFNLTNGLSRYTATITQAASVTQTISFGNGASIALNAFNGNANKAQETYTVAAGTGVTAQFQYGELASDVLSLSFSGATATALGINASAVDTATNAVTASAAIDAAMKSVGQFIAQLGGKASQLGFMADNLRVNIQNQTAAASTFVDADISESMMSLQKFKGLANIASTVFTQALNQQSELSTMVGQVR